jgi:hypothetical protein
MAESDFQHTTNKGTGIVELVTTALAQERRAGISEMLHVVAQAVDAVGSTRSTLSPVQRHCHSQGAAFFQPVQLKFEPPDLFI